MTTANFSFCISPQKILTFGFRFTFPLNVSYCPQLNNWASSPLPFSTWTCQRRLSSTRHRVRTLRAPAPQTTTLSSPTMLCPLTRAWWATTMWLHGQIARGHSGRCARSTHKDTFGLEHMVAWASSMGSNKNFRVLGRNVDMHIENFSTHECMASTEAAQVLRCGKGF